MKTLHPQYIVDANLNKTSVILPIEEWENVLDLMEELEDVMAYDRAKSIDDDVLSFDQAIGEIEARLG